jgi:hypothetical protein
VTGAEPYLRNINEQIVLAAWTNSDGITFEPFIDGRALGYRITECATGRVEYIVLSPTDVHEVNEANGATADTFVYAVDPKWAKKYDERTARETQSYSVIDYAEVVTYVNHFENESEDDE